jgi:LacI family transcriptional regulator
MGPRNTSTARDRAKGALSVLKSGADAEPAVLWGHYTSEHGYSSTMQVLARPEPPTAIIAGNDTIALGVLEAAQVSGVAVPKRLSVIGFDDNPASGSPLIGLTTVRQPVEAMARTTARRLLERIGAKNINPTTRDLLPTQLIVRQTTGSA